MVSHFTLLSAITACALVSPCDAIENHREVEGVRLNLRSSGHLLVQRTATTQATATAPEVDKMFDGLSEKARKIFPDDVARDALEKLSMAYEGRAMSARPAHHSKRELMHTIGEFMSGGTKGTFLDHADNTMVYGEVMPHAVLHMLAVAAEKNPNLRNSQGQLKPGHFYDLGSGYGKTVVLASLLGFEGDGVERRDDRFDTACQGLHQLGLIGAVQNASSLADAIGRLQQDEKDDADGETPHTEGAVCGSDGMGKAKFSMGSFTDPKMDISDGDVVFTDSVFWTPDMMTTLGQKASRMKSGSIIVSYKPFPGEAFEDLGQIQLPATWGKVDVPYSLQRVK